MVGLKSIFAALIAVFIFPVVFTDDLEACKILNEESFDDTVAEANTFVMFYAPWCGHCKRLKPTWNEFCEKTNVEGSETTIAAVDCTTDGYTCKKHGVSGYPTLKLFKKGEDEGTKYQGGRDIPSFQKFIQKTLNPGAVEPEPAVEACKLTEPENGLLVLKDCNFAEAIEKGTSFVKFYAPWCGHCKRMAPAWSDLAAQLESVSGVNIAKIDCTVEKSVCSKYDVHGYPTVQLFKDGKLVEKYQGGREVETLKKYLDGKVNGTSAAAAKKPAQKCDKSSADDKGMWELQDCHFEHHIAHSEAFVMFYAPWCGHCKKLKPTWEKLAESYQGYESVRISKIDCTVHKESCAKYKVKGFPTLIYFRRGKELGSYGGSREFSNLKEFVETKLAQVVIPERGANQGKEEPRKIGKIETAEQLKELRSDIRHSFVVIYHHESNEQHKKERKVYEDFNDRLMKGVDVKEVDCEESEKLCKEEKAYSDDETFVLFYMGTQVYRMDSNIPKTSDSMKAFVKESMKKAVEFMRDEL